MYKKFFIGKEQNLTGRTFMWTVLSGIVYSLQSLVFLIVITNFLGDVAGGVYSVGMMVAQQMLTVGKFAVRNYQVSDVRNQYGFNEYFGHRILTCALAIFITVGWIIFGGYRGEYAIVIISLTIYKIAECFADLFEGVYQQKFRFDISGRSQFVKDFTMIIAYAGMLIVTRNVVVSSVVLAVISVLLVVIIDLPLTKYFTPLKISFKWKSMVGLTVACFSLFVSSFLNAYIHNAPKYAINGMGEGSGIALTHFNALFMPTFAVDMLAGFTMRIWITKMAVFHDRGDRKGFKNILLKQVGVISLITVVSMVVMYFFGGFALTLIYGIDLYGYNTTNALLMLAGGMVSFYTLFENVIIIYRHQQFSIVINIVSAVFAAIVVPICTRQAGILGATVGYLLTNGVRALGYFLTALYYMIKEKKKSQKD